MFKKLALLCTVSFLATMTIGCKHNYVDTPPEPAKVKVANKQTVSVTKQSLNVHQAIKKYSREYKVDEKTIHAIVMTESSYNPKAVSRCGAIGLMQIMPRTGEAHNCGDLFNVEKNISCGAKHYAGMLARYNGDEVRALASYNLGGGRVHKDKPVPTVGLAYANKVISNRKKVVLN